jgi:hypothetical protein
MPETRRSFLALAAAAAMPRPAAEIQVPKMKFGGVEISRLLVGCNPFYGYSHFNKTYSAVMREYYTAERVCDVLHQANRFGINAHNMFPAGRGIADYEHFVGEGGKMHLVAQGVGDDLVGFIRTHKPLAVYHHGGRTDDALAAGQFNKVREWCKQIRDTGVRVGVGTHRPEVIERIESEAWDVDFYAGCVYNISRSDEEWRRLLGGQLMEMPRDGFVQDDPPRMFATIRATPKPCFAFKILAAGRVGNVEAAFRRAFASIKPTDGVFVGMFPRAADEVREDAELTHRILTTH